MNALAAAMVMAGVTLPLPASALGLGKLTVQSALGEPLQAEIDLPDLTDAEANGLRVGLASSDVYRAASVDFNALLANTQIQLQRRPNGQAYLKVTNNRAINEPYLDLILEISWSTGRIVRDYTMLFDPPSLRRTPLVAPLPAATSPVNATAARSAPAGAAPTLPSVGKSASAAAVSPRPATAAPAPVPAPKAPSAVPAAAPVPDTLTVKAGDTAGRIASAHKPTTASLDQMLIAMLRANPQAFINGNINQIKAGAVIELPSMNEVTATSPGEARQIVAAQSRDFNAFRQRLAAAATAVAPNSQGRQAKGTVQAEVSDQRAEAQTPDQLKLTKGSLAGKKEAGAAEEAIAQARQAQETAARTAELNRNIAALSQIAPGAAAAAAASGPAAAAAAPADNGASTAAPSLPVAATVPVPGATASDVPAAPPPPAADSPAATEAPAQPAPVTVPAPTPEPPAELSFVDELLDNPLVLPAAGGLLVLLLGLVGYRMRSSKKTATVDSSYLESRLQPDSFFGASGGQSVDTAEAAATGSSLMYSPSQLDTGGDVDPVAEADVYLAYGRDLQAEEILKEAMRISPTRVAVHSKMLEIYAKRRDAKSFEVLAGEVYALTQGNGPVWEHARELGLELAPDNPLYQPGGQPDNSPKPSPAAMAMDAIAPATVPLAIPAGAAAVRGSETPPAASTPLEVDLDLDLDLDFSSDPAPTAQTPVVDIPAPTAEPDGNGLDFDAAEFDIVQPPTHPPASQVEPAHAIDDNALAFDLSAFDSVPDIPLNALAPSPAPTSVADSGDFDLSFDLSGMDVTETPAAAPSSHPVTAPSQASSAPSFNLADLSLDLDDEDTLSNMDGLEGGDPLETKLSLAAEFLTIGDEDGARSLAEEVLELATGPLKEKANAFLANLG